MYSYEIEELLRLRNYLINNKEYIHICNTSPQINYAKYEAYEDKIYIHTSDNYDFKFKVYKIEDNKRGDK